MHKLREPRFVCMIPVRSFEHCPRRSRWLLWSSGSAKPGAYFRAPTARISMHPFELWSRRSLCVLSSSAAQIPVRIFELQPRVSGCILSSPGHTDLGASFRVRVWLRRSWCILSSSDSADPGEYFHAPAAQIRMPSFRV